MTAAAGPKAQDFIDFGRIRRGISQRIHPPNAFVIGAYYPALTGACALGERILNHLVLLLREDYRGSAEYKRVYSKLSFDNWDLPIKTLASWNVLLPEVTKAFKELRDIRTKAIHFRPEVDTNDRSIALEAIRCLLRIIEEQFGAHGREPWMFMVPGETYIKKTAEREPFVHRVYVANCALVGPQHTLSNVDRKWVVHDDYEYDTREVTDQEFAELRALNKS